MPAASPANVSPIHMLDIMSGIVQHTKPLTSPYTGSRPSRPSVVSKASTPVSTPVMVPLMRANTANGAALQQQAAVLLTLMHVGS